jgi:hypothetical protein
MKHFVIALFCTTLIFFATGCTPSEGDGRRFIEQTLIGPNGTGPDYKVVEFKQTNGEEVDYHGMPLYLMHYEATLECTHVGGCCINQSIFEQCTQAVGNGQKWIRNGMIKYRKGSMMQGWRAVGDRVLAVR